MTTPFVVLVDTREKDDFAYTFERLTADYRDNYRPLIVRTRCATLESGDYSLEDFENRVTCERKSAADLFSTIGQQRDRFERELARLQGMEHAAVVVEAGWDEILNNPPPFTTLSPKIVFRSVVAWQQRFHRVHWWFLPNRRLAEVTCFRILERFWRDNNGRGG